MEKGLVGQLPNPSKYVVLGYVRWWNIPDSLTKPEIWFCKIKNNVMTGSTTWKQLGVHCNLEERLSPSNECIRLITLTYHYYTLHWKWSGWLKFHKPSKNNLLKRRQSWPDLKKKRKLSCSRRNTLTCFCSGCTGTGIYNWCRSCGSGSPWAAQDEPGWLCVHRPSRKVHGRPARCSSAMLLHGTFHE